MGKNKTSRDNIERAGNSHYIIYIFSADMRVMEQFACTYQIRIYVVFFCVLVETVCTSGS